MSAAGAQGIGVDVGGTKTAAVRIDAEGSVLAREVRQTPAEDMGATLDTMVETARAVLTPDVEAVGLAAAGLVEKESGILRFAPNLAWRDAQLVGFVGDALELPAVADNDATAAVWGEFRCGAGQGHDHVLFIGVGTGIGGGIVAGGQLMRGAHGFAAEIGHVIVEPGGEPCGCGNRGCWETVASGSTILRDCRRAISGHARSMLVEITGGDPARLTGEMVTEAAVAGDATARGILVEVGHRLGEGIAGLVNILDPEIVVVGGGASTAGELLLEPVRAAFLMAVEAPDRRPDVPIVAAALGNDAGGIGAALLALEALG